ncbi:MAG: primosomal protein N' [Alistipes sp.]|nr:primosomal protein N' [Candidatus Alistipes equi]
MENAELKYVEVVLPLAQPMYTYCVPEGISLTEGDGVIVPFGKNAVYTAIVWRFVTKPSQHNVKSIIEKAYTVPFVSQRKMKLWEWIADYYMCTIGEVMRVALPSMIKPHSKTTDDFRKFLPKTETFILPGELSTTLCETYQKKYPKRRQILDYVSERGSVAKKDFPFSHAILKALVQDGLLVLQQRESLHSLSSQEFALPKLSSAQQEAFNSIQEAFKGQTTCLLNGVTGSGKTEIYMHFISEALSRKEDVLYLVPEISLTPQLENRLRSIFLDCVTIYHSALTSRQRTDAYTALLHSRGGNIVLGARSALFLPLENLGLVIIDEEQDTSYKQTEPNPRYNGRDTALMLAHIYGAKTILGSATPSLESYVACRQGKYQRVDLMERFGGAQLPKLILCDTALCRQRREMHGEFSKFLLDAIRQRLNAKEQTIIFQNRRGYASYVECKECGWVPKCPKCSIPLTSHHSKMVCHYCGHTIQIPLQCPSCASTLKMHGYGTQRIETDLQKFFPDARILRLDADTASSYTSYSDIIKTFSEGGADILVGTQILTKGLDFGNVTLIGILNSSSLLNNVDFRSSEHTWQLFNQVAGRAGRRSKSGQVVIQTPVPTHPFFKLLGFQCYSDVAQSLLQERKDFFYPPYVRIIRILIRHTKREVLQEAAAKFSEMLRARFGARVFGPVAPLIERLRNEYRQEMLLKIEVESSFSKARDILREELLKFQDMPNFKYTTIIFDVDAI